MRSIKTYDEKYRNILNDNVAVISENILDEANFDNFMQNEFTAMFEDVILNGTVILFLEGQNWDNVKGWLKNKWSDLKTAVSNFIKKIGQIINSAVLGKFMMSIKAKFKELAQEVLDLFDSMKIAVIKHNLILDGNKPNFKKITQYVMDIVKKEKKVDDATINSISSAAGELKTESLYINNDVLRIDENLSFVNASLNEFLGWGKPKTKPEEQPAAKPTTPTAPTTPAAATKPATPDEKLVTFGVDSTDAEGTNVTKEQLANTGIGIFTKLLLKIGINNPRAQVALTKIGTMLMGIVIAAIITLVVTGGAGVAVTGTAGWAFTGVAFSIVTVIAGLFFAFGVFLLMCWFRKPYPSLEDYQEYLEAWFHLYPDGKRPKKKKKGNVDNFKGGGGTPKPGFGKYEEERLKRDDTCTLLRKWNKLKKKGEDTPETQQNINNIVAHLVKRKCTDGQLLTPETFEKERQICKEKKIQEKPQGKMVSYKDEQTGKYRTGVVENKPKVKKQI